MHTLHNSLSSRYDVILELFSWQFLRWMVLQRPPGKRSHLYSAQAFPSSNQPVRLPKPGPTPVTPVRTLGQQPQLHPKGATCFSYRPNLIFPSSSSFTCSSSDTAGPERSWGCLWLPGRPLGEDDKGLAAIMDTSMEGVYSPLDASLSCKSFQVGR